MRRSRLAPFAPLIPALALAAPGCDSPTGPVVPTTATPSAPDPGTAPASPIKVKGRTLKPGGAGNLPGDAGS